MNISNKNTLLQVGDVFKDFFKVQYNLYNGVVKNLSNGFENHITLSTILVTTPLSFIILLVTLRLYKNKQYHLLYDTPISISQLKHSRNFKNYLNYKHAYLIFLSNKLLQI